MDSQLTIKDWEAIKFMAPRTIKQLEAHIRGYQNCPKTPHEKKQTGIEKSEELMASVYKLEALAEFNLDKTSHL